jgi:hypothetical protein
VVAADKGTATFSDVANAIALERGFWLGDAFASGGSNGYDHKAMGITAGRLDLVQRHFREMGVDVQTQPIRSPAVGDMSGDVFGNGMLLSKAIKLVAAFDHRHIFIDPDPDPARAGRSATACSTCRARAGTITTRAADLKGGGIFPRSQKSIPLSPEVARAAGHRAEEIDPATLITRDPQGAGRPALVRRHRHLHQGARPSAMPRSAIPPTTRSGSMLRAARQGDRRRRQPGHHPGRPDRVRQRRRAHQHRLHRQFGRRRLLGQ